MQRGTKKYVRMYSETYNLLASGVEGSCSLQNDEYFCGRPQCNTHCTTNGYTPIP